MAIKQLQLYYADIAEKNLNVLKNTPDEFDQWSRSEEHIERLIKNLSEHVDLVREQEQELSDAIEDGWSIYHSYPIESGKVQGVRFVLYKRSNP